MTYENPISSDHYSDAIGRFCQQNQFFDFLFSSKIKNLTLLLSVPIVIIVGELSNGRNKPVT